MQENDFNRDFFSKTANHLYVFDCGKYNLYKVVQDALLRRTGQVKLGVFRNKIALPGFLIRLIFLLKNRANKKDIQNFIFPGSGTLLISPARVDNGKHIYLENIIEALKDNPVVVNMSNHAAFPQGLNAEEIKQHFGNLMPDASSLMLAGQLNQTFKKIQGHEIFSIAELKHVLTGLNEFWWSVSLWSRFLRLNNFKRVFLIPGYQTENIIFACKEAGVEVIELQHGIISANSSFFMYPAFMKEIASRALFPDKIFVFGPYWKNLLLKGNEFTDSQIEIIGDYFYKPEYKLQSKPYNEKKLIVFAGQKPVSVAFQRDYLLFLREGIRNGNQGFIIIHKPHPLEDQQVYSEIYDDILITSEYSVSALIPHAEIFISMFSTTLYEARENGVKTFALYYPDLSPFINDVIENDVAIKLMPDQNPVDFSGSRKIFPKGYFYSSFSTGLLKGT